MKKASRLLILSLTLGIVSATISQNFASEKGNVKNYFSEAQIDEEHYRESIYDEPGVKPVKMQIMDYDDYSQLPSGENLYNTQKNYHLNSLNLGTTWNNYRGDGVTVAAIDTGINYEHQDFVYYGTTGTSISNKSASFEDPGATGTATKKTVATYGWSVMSDANGHGTNVASTIASRINGTGCVGVAPNVNLMFLKCPNLMSSEVSAAIRYAADNGADIITMSLGMYAVNFTSPYSGEAVAYSSSASSLFSSAITYAHNKGCIILASAGNDNTSYASYPASNNYVIGVGALAKDSRTDKANYSNFNNSSNTKSSNNNVDVTVCGSVYVASKDSTSSYKSTQGTSFSCPITAAALALYCQSHPTWTEATATKALYDSCTDIGSTGWDTTYGYGCVDISALVGISYDLEGINISQTSASIYSNNDTLELTATTNPSYATASGITWTTSNSTVASISTSSTTSGQSITVTGKKAGTATITAKSSSDNSKSAVCNVTVNQYYDSTFTVDSTMSLTVGDEKLINVNWTNASPTIKELAFESSNEDVCTVSDSGVVKALSAGSSTITVVSTDDIKEIEVTVSAEPAGDYVLVTDASTLKAGDKLLFVSETAKKCNGGLNGNNFLAAVDVSISNHTISSLPTDAAPLTLGGTSGSWTFTINGNYTLYSSSSAFSTTSSTSSYNTYTIAISSNNVTIKANGSYQIYYNSGSPRFRAYTSVQAAFQLYKKTDGSTPTVTNYTVSFDKNGGAGTMDNATTNGSSYVVPECSYTYEGYTFDKWALNSATGTKYSVGDTISDISKDITLYATWKANSSGDGEDDGEYQYYNGNYYDPITNDQISEGGTSLITALKNLIQPKSAFGYANIWTFNENYDKYPSDYDGTDPLTGNVYPTTNNTQKRGKMWDMYSDQTWTGSSQRCGNYSTIGDAYNREHSLPKSWFGGSDSNQPGTDPNHLFNTDGKVNGMRSNYPYGEAVKDITFDGYTLADKKAIGFGKLGKNLSNTIVFEPDDAYKGDFARAQMYMATAYYNWNLTQDTGGAYCFTYSNGVSTMKSYYIDLLTKWSAEDPVSQKEIDRNNAVYNSSQKNRNPFIDHPTWANKIWGGTPYTWNGKTSDDEPVSVTGVSINKTTASITVGGSLTLIPTVTPNNASNKSVNWSSSNEKVATVSNGVVTGVSTGETTIKVITVDGSFEATCVVTVTENESAESITITRDSCSGTGGYSWYSWSSGDISGQLYYYASEKSKIQMNSSKTGKALFSSTSSGSNIKSITIKSASGTPNFTVYGSNSAYSTTNVSSGTSIGSKNSSTSGVKWDFGSNDFEYFSIVLGGSAAGYISEVIIEYKASSGTTPSITSVTVSPKTLSLDLYNKKTGDLSANVVVTNGAAQTVYWSSSDSTVATVDSNGKVTALKVGSATITATSTVDSTKNDTCTVTVDDSTPVAVTGVTLNKTSASISLGNTITLVATVTPTNATNKNVTWSSSDESVATVSDGVVTSKAVGTATITVTTEEGGFTASCTVTVTAAPVITYQLEADQETVSYMSGTDHQVSVGVKLYQYSNGVKGSQVASSTGSVDTSVLGPTIISYTYQSVTYKTTVKVTNNGAIQNKEGSSTNTNATFTKQVFTKNETQTVGDLSLTLSNNGTYYGYDSTKGQQIGSSNKPAKSMSLTTSVEGTITKVIVNTSGGSSVSATVSVKVGSTSFKCGTSTSKSISATATSYEFTGSASGDIVISWSQTSSKALYFKSIEITTTTEGTKVFSNEEQAKAWSDYFIKLTGGGEFDGPCKEKTPEAKKAALQEVWGELKSEYIYMVEDSKTAFCSADATETIAEAVQHYRYIVATYGLEDFAEVPQVSSSNRLIPVVDSQSFVLVIVAMVGSLAICGLLVYKKRKED